MVLIIVSVVSLISLLLGRRLYHSLYNPISIYVLIWFFQILLFEWRLIRYQDLHTRTWIAIAGAFFCFLAGNYILPFFRKLSHPTFIETTADIEPWYMRKIGLTLIIYSTGVIGMVGALQHWSVLFREFGSLANIMLNASKIYSMRVAGELQGMLPYITCFLNVSLFFSGLYTARTGKLSGGLLLSFGGVILDDLANMGREGMLFAFFEFISIIFVYRIAQRSLPRKNSVNKRLVISFAIILILVASFATLIKSLRSGSEHLRGSSRALNKIQSGTLISPSIYLYFSSQIAVLDKYLEKENEAVMWGENTFLPFYNLIAKTEVVQKPQIYQKGYYVPVWTNTGTYLRELHADFGILGVLGFPLLLGWGLFFLWMRYQESKNLNYFVSLVYLLIVLKMSFLMMITRSAKWWISMIFVYLIINARDIMKFFQADKMMRSISNE